MGCPSPGHAHLHSLLNCTEGPGGVQTALAECSAYTGGRNPYNPVKKAMESQEGKLALATLGSPGAGPTDQAPPPTRTCLAPLPVPAHWTQLGGL